MVTLESIRPSALPSRIGRTLERRVANPVFRTLLRSRLHWLASRWLALLSYRGRRSERRYTTPVAYARRDGALVVVTLADEANWWTNFRDPHECTLWLRGTPKDATGVVVTDGAERDALLAEYARDRRLLAPVLGVDGDRTGRTSDDGTVENVVVVRFDLDP